MPRSVEKAEDMMGQNLSELGPKWPRIVVAPVAAVVVVAAADVCCCCFSFFLRKTERSLPVKWHDEVVEPVPESAAPLCFSLGLPGAGPA